MIQNLPGCFLLISVLCVENLIAFDINHDLVSGCSAGILRYIKRKLHSRTISANPKGVRIDKSYTITRTALFLINIPGRNQNTRERQLHLLLIKHCVSILFKNIIYSCLLWIGQETNRQDHTSNHRKYNEPECRLFVVHDRLHTFFHSNFSK